ncbi:MFS transporter [Bacillus cereus]|uniref:MFS transporter n=1 Tax=Bacillus cereus TaxID=1396 RepID=UPI0020CA7C8B|nr:MFS transporter [Bacillus cereus]
MNKSKSNTESFTPIIVAVFLGSFLSILNMSTINVAIPEIMRNFQTDLNSVQWTLTGFILATGIIAPITGYLGDKFSYKYLYFFSLLGFTLFSALCAFAWNISSLIGFRILQGGCYYPSPRKGGISLINKKLYSVSKSILFDMVCLMRFLRFIIIT